MRFRASQSSWEDRWVRFPGARLWLWSPTKMAWTRPRARSSGSLPVWLCAAHLPHSSVPGGCRVCVQEGVCRPALRLKLTWGFCIYSRKGLLLCADPSPFQYVKIMTLSFICLPIVTKHLNFFFVSCIWIPLLDSLLGYTFSCWLENYASFVLQESKTS